MFDLAAIERPATLADAFAALEAHPGASILAGGTDALVKLRDGKLTGREWVSIHGLSELKTIEMDADGTLRVGALNSFSHVASNELVRSHVNSLPEALLTIGGPQVRNMGTIGGNICNGVPSADSASTCFAWDADIEIASASGTRVVPIRDFYLGAKHVDLNPGEIMTAVLFRPDRYEGYQGAYLKYAMRNAMDIATVNCAAVVRLSPDASTFADVRLAYGVAAPTPIRTPSGEQALIGQPVTAESIETAARAALSDTKARDSWRASKSLRLQALYTMTRRCLTTAAQRCGSTIGATK